MTRTVDQLQKELSEAVFNYATDRKKAAGRALGTIVEIIAYYKLCSWGFSKNTLIEKRIPEFGRPDITHNVEFSIHKAKASVDLEIPRDGRTINARNIGLAADIDLKETKLEGTLLDSTRLLRNSAQLGQRDGHLIVANLLDFDERKIRASLTDLAPHPVAIFECKRVGVEEGMKKGPQSIEKAKQGAYVARSVSALQKVIDKKGNILGFLPMEKGGPLVDDYDKMLKGVVYGKFPVPEGFMLTVGVTSNHGNWFTAENANKELKVLAAAYDWLLFLTDGGLMEFVHECVIEPSRELSAIKTAFQKSYDGTKSGNRFTKTKIDLDADRALRRYFKEKAKSSDKWFNVIEPKGQRLEGLARQLESLLRR